MYTWTLGVKLLRRWAACSYRSSRVGMELFLLSKSEESKSSNFSLCVCYPLPHGKGIKSAAKRQHRLSGTKECFSNLLSGHMHLLSSSYTGGWRTYVHYKAAFSALGSNGRKMGSTRQEPHTDSKQVCCLRPYLLYNLDITTKVIRASKPGTQESFKMNRTSVFHYLLEAEIFWKNFPSIVKS